MVLRDTGALIQARLVRATEALLGAAAEFSAGRFNNATNRAYYAAFHIGVAVRIASGDAMDNSGQWEHGATNRRFREIIAVRTGQARNTRRLLSLRERADYYVDSSAEAITFELAAIALSDALGLAGLTRRFLSWP